jgi:hypothetical protein
MWTRLSLISAVVVYLLLFVFKNRNNNSKIDFVFKEYNDLNVLLVVLFTAIFSIFGWWLLKTVLRAVRQLKDINRRGRMDRIEREHSDMVAKAARLQTRTETTPPPAV